MKENETQEENEIRGETRSEKHTEIQETRDEKGQQRTTRARPQKRTQSFTLVCSLFRYMRRRHTFYIMNVILPSILTSVLLLSIFFCTPGQKVRQMCACLCACVCVRVCVCVRQSLMVSVLPLPIFFYKSCQRVCACVRACACVCCFCLDGPFTQVWTAHAQQ